MKKETGQSVRVGSGSVIGGPSPPTGSVPGVSRAPTTTTTSVGLWEGVWVNAHILSEYIVIHIPPNTVYIW